MNYFWQEYIFFIVSAFALLVCASTAWLFLLSVRLEKKLQTAWRATGFFTLALAFFLFILERKFEIFGLLGVIAEVIGFFCIYKGVVAEPVLADLIDKVSDKIKHREGRHLNFVTKEYVSKKPVDVKRLQSMLLKGGLLLLAILLIVFLYVYLGAAGGYLTAGLILVTVLFIALTIRLQVKRYIKHSHIEAHKAQNLYPLVGYVFLFLRGVSLALHRLPELDVVVLREFTLDFSILWQLALVYTFLAFLFLGVWAWNFIKTRAFLRTYIIIFIIALLVSSLGSLVFSTFIFRIVESNNLSLMMQGAKTQNLILQEYSNTALLVSRTLGNDRGLIEDIGANNYDALFDQSENYLKSSGADIVRVYNSSGEILVSPNDIRDEGRNMSTDVLVDYALTEKKHIRAFDTKSGVLSPIIVTRAVYPVVSGEEVIGVVEVGYKFDNAFVDYSKEQTGMDVTLYAGAKRAATTIKTLDEVSRWVGSQETDPKVIEQVLGNGESYGAQVDRLGRVYYSAFKPIRDVRGRVIGMVSVGVPTSILFEDTRQQLVSTFLIVTVMSILVALFGYYTIRKLDYSDLIRAGKK